MIAPVELTINRRLLDRRLSRDGFPVSVVENTLTFRKKPFPKCFVQLGRYGDLLIVLRALKMVADWTGTKPKLVVSHTYADILDGVSYVEPILIQKDWYGGMEDAVAIARSMYPDSFTVTQCYGHNWGNPNQTKEYPNFMAAMWHRTGVPMEFLDFAPLVMDKRNPEREARLVNSIKRNGRPILLYNFKGVSSPFLYSPQVQNAMLSLRGAFQLVDLATIKGERMYDLLGVFDIAAGMVTIDTGTLHLAHACKIPVLAFTVDNGPGGGWTRSSAIPNQVFASPYGMTLVNLPGFVKTLQTLATRREITSRFFHCYSDYIPQDPNTRRRVILAQRSWRAQPWADIPVSDSSLPRMFEDGPRKIPFIKDLFNKAVSTLTPDDILVFTNADIHMRSDACVMIQRKLKAMDACYCFRRDFHHTLKEPLSDSDYLKGIPYAGSDLYAFRVKWWMENSKHFPDMLCGAEAWDAVLRVLIERTHQGRNPMLTDIIAHERHGSFWENPANRYSVPSQKHNLKLAWAWFSAQGIDPNKYGVRNI